MAKKRHLLSYLAGVFDGEGYIGIQKRRARPPKQPNISYVAYIQVAMTDEIVPRLFHITFGGKFMARKPDKKNHKVQYIWYMCGRDCGLVIKELMPYSLLKRPQFEVVLHFLNTLKPWGYWNGLTEEELALREVDFLLCKSLKTKVSRNQYEPWPKK